MSNSLIVLPYSEVPGETECVVSTATPESLKQFLETLGFEVVAVEQTSSLRGFALKRDDLDRPREIYLHEFGVALYLDYLSAVDFYAGCCRWLRGHLPEDLSIPLQFLSDSGSPFFEVDFENLEEQIRREFNLD